MDDRSGEVRLEVSREDEGERLDRFLSRRLGISRRQAMREVEMGRVEVEGRSGRKGQSLLAGQLVSARLPPWKGPLPQPELPLRVIHQDPSILVVEKESGLPTHPLEALETGTLANAVAAVAPECAAAGEDPREGGAAHRLDAGTSGLVVFARDRASWLDLRSQFAARTVEKEYVALVQGEVASRAILDRHLARTPGDPGKMRLAREGEPGAVEAWTLVEPIRALPGWTLVRCTIRTGAMHQIRVHLSSFGHPIAGDARYGGPSPGGLQRLFLHASTLGFRHPGDGRRLRFSSPLPEGLEQVLGDLSLP